MTCKFKGDGNVFTLHTYEREIHHRCPLIKTVVVIKFNSTLQALVGVL